MRWLIAVLTIFAGFLCVNTGQSCTVGVVSGGVTLDGRPLLWKNRDTRFRDNEIAFFRGKRYDFIGIINKNDTTQVWMGLNTAGFAIMNAESLDQPGDSLDTEGYFMKRALSTCGSLLEFEQLLAQSNREKRGTKANFGCIDAYGGAAIYETGNRRFTRIDARNPVTSPYGFVVRANFSMSGTGHDAYGAWRFHRAFELCKKGVLDYRMTHSYLLKTVDRDIHAWEVDPYPLPFEGEMQRGKSGFINTHNCINRHRTVSCAVFHGVQAGEDPALATLWCILGEPVAGVAIPLWVRSGEVKNDLNGKKGADLNFFIQEIESLLYHDSANPRMIDTRRLSGGRYDIINEFCRFEQEIFEKTILKLRAWRKEPPAPDDMRNFQNRMLKQVMRFLRR